MQAGQFKSRVLIQQPSGAVDELGTPVPGDWVDVTTVWANVRYLSGMATIKADAQSATAKASIRIRYRTGLTTAMRVLHGATVFRVTAVLPDEQRREYVDLTVEAIQ